jgi:molecular chaperone DnaK (HSP70)
MESLKLSSSSKEKHINFTHSKYAPYGIDKDERNRLDLHRLYSKTVKDAVITVPGYFNDSQRQSTKDAYYTKILVSLIA